MAMGKPDKNFWILTGNEENWETALSSGNVWGVREGNLVGYWKKLEKDDLLLFYVTSPIAGVIGVGRLESKFKQDKPLWPDEIRAKKVIYPYRFDFKILGVVSPEKWQLENISVRDLNANIRAGINSVKNPQVIKEIIARLNERWEIDFKYAPQEKKEKIPSSIHDQIRDKLVEIGTLEKFISEKEYPIDGERLDVTWRRVVRGVPTRVFEVQVGGSVHQALSKLKHSFDLWNSEPYLIIDDKSRQKAEELLSGTFHELKEHVKVIPLDKVDQLYKALTSEKNLKEEFGLG